MTFNFNAPVGQVIAGDQTVTGDNIGTQNNYYGTDDPNTQQLAIELDELLQGIVPRSYREAGETRVVKNLHLATITYVAKLLG